MDYSYIQTANGKYLVFEGENEHTKDIEHEYQARSLVNELIGKKDGFRTLDLISDPGHGWLAVTMQEVKDLGIFNDVSNYSYMRGEMAYLEEDCDMGLFCEALQKKGIAFNFNEIYQENTQIRNYRSIH